MRRTRLVLLLTFLWLGFCCLGAFALALVTPGPGLYWGQGAGALGLAIAGWAIGNSSERRHRKALSALGEATGNGAIGAQDELIYTGEIIANLCLRLERARLFQTAFEQSGQPALIAEADGRIVKLSAGIAARAPECAESDTIAALFGADVPRNESEISVRVRFAGYDWRARSTPLGGDRWLVGLERPGVAIAQRDWHAMTQALAGGDTGFRFGAEALAGNPDLEVANHGFAALDESAASLMMLAQNAEHAEIAPTNGGLNPHIRALAETIGTLARHRDAEAGAGAEARLRLEKIGALVEQCRKSASELTAAAEAARLSSDTAREAFATGREKAEQLADVGSQMRGRAGEAGAAARRANENVSSLQTLAREIDVLVAGIEDVSFRTNLLALNAAVEAARAGEKGAGFAVVAAEVRELAQTSAKNSKTIRSLVAKSLSEAGAGTEQARALLGALGDIDTHLLNLSDETAMMAGTLEDGGRALTRVQIETGALVDHARAQAAALSADEGQIGQTDGSKSRRM